MRLWPTTKSSLLLAGGLKLLELNLGLKLSAVIFGLPRLCSKLSDSRNGRSCWTILLLEGDEACALEVAPPVAAPSLASFIGSCCLIDRLVDEAAAAFCSFLALIKFMGSGKLLQLSRLFSRPRLLELLAVDVPPETAVAF